MVRCNICHKELDEEEIKEHGRSHFDEQNEQQVNLTKEDVEALGLGEYDEYR